MLAHNGEINTVWGNRARMDARAATFPAECQPILTKDGSDSTSLDEAVELLARNGRTVAEAVRMSPSCRPPERIRLLLPTPTAPSHGTAQPLLPLPMATSSACLDRNGLRPCRFFLTEDKLVVPGSEAGLVDLDPETIVHSGRLGPGQMLVADLDGTSSSKTNRFRHLRPPHRIRKAPGRYHTRRPRSPRPVEDLTQLQQLFGYTREDVNMILKPMAMDGKDAVWSMGDDTPLAPLARSPRPVYAFFRQRFAQVTNPPTDPLREASCSNCTLVSAPGRTCSTRMLAPRPFAVIALSLPGPDA